MKKAGLATGELQKAFPPICPAERSVDRTPKGITLACMTASREPSNQSFEVDREATVCFASRRFLFVGSAGEAELSLRLKNEADLERSDRLRNRPVLRPA